MKNFIVYDSTGKILRSGVCQDNLLQAQAGDDESIMEGIGTHRTHYISLVDPYNPTVCNKTPEQIASERSAGLRARQGDNQ